MTVLMRKQLCGDTTNEADPSVETASGTGLTTVPGGRIAERHAPPDPDNDRSDPLDVFFTPRTLAVIGATDKPGSVGRSVLSNLIGGPLGDAIFPVNPKHSEVLGKRAWPDIASVPKAIDLAVIVTPARVVPEIVRECAVAGVRGAIVISAGFREIGVEGAELEHQIMEEARCGKLRIIGPNCLGLMNPVTGLNATFAAGIARPGHVGFISQSGALCTAILDWSLREMVGFSAFVSIGSMLDIGWADMIYHLGNDPQTRSIVIYMESVGDARSFLSAAREVSLTKPIIVIKTGRTVAAAKAAASHTGSLSGSDEVLDAAFRRCGVLRVDRISDLFHMAEVLDKQPRPRGPRLMILTNAGGPGVLATDAVISEGGVMAELAPETLQALDAILPSHWSHQNPIDIIGDAGPERYEKAIEIAVRDENSDGLLVILTPQGMTNPTAIAEKLQRFSHLGGKPLLASWMGGNQVAEGEMILNRAGIPTFAYPDTAARAFEYMWRYSDNLRALYETPVGSNDIAVAARDQAAGIIQDVRQQKRTILTEFESKELLAAYGIPTVQTLLAPDEEQAVFHARRIGYPVVLKLNSTTITHKTDVGGVKLNLADESAVREAYRAIQTSVSQKAGFKHFQGVTVQPMVSAEGYELILGSSVDPQFGPVLLFGSGGQLVEVIRDRALALPPLNTTLARRMMERTRIYTALQGVRGRKPIDIAGLEQLVVRFSRLVADQSFVREVDINPLLVSADRFLALDARVVLHHPDLTGKDIPRLAIAPYPSQYIKSFVLKEGTTVTIRPIRPEDEVEMVKFHESLSDQSVHSRYFHMVNLGQRAAHDRLVRTCFIDYDREMALVAERSDSSIIGVGRLIMERAEGRAEFAVVVSDGFQGRGLGTELIRGLFDVARCEGIHRIVGEVLPDNCGILRVCRKAGFHLSFEDRETVKAEIVFNRRNEKEHL